MVVFDRKEDPLFIKWALAVKKRDHFECQICERRGVELHSHHQNGWNLFPDERYDLDNGCCLCSDCHEGFHNIYGKGNNTSLQFEEYRLFCRSFIKNSKKNITIEKIIEEVSNKLEKDVK